MPSPHVVMVSLVTPDGGKSDVVTDVPRSIAARMVVEGSARRATEAEAASYREQQATARQAASDAATANRLQVVIVPATATGTKPPTRSGKEQ